jgi:hypothetical protein
LDGIDFGGHGAPRLSEKRLKLIRQRVLNGTTTKPTLTFTSLKCLSTTEKAADRIELRVYFPDPRASFTDGAIMKNSQEWTLPKGKRPFDGDVRVELWELDPELFGKDDKLGTCIIRPSERGAKEVRFTGRAGVYLWAYLLRYRVDP